MMTKEELLTIPKGSKYPIEWDKSKIVEVLERRKKVGVWGFYIHNLITQKTYVLWKGFPVYYFTIMKPSEMVRLGQLLPKRRRVR